MYQKCVKRPIDFLLSLCALLALSPVLLVTAIFVGVKLGRPVLFCQERPGRDGTIFKMYKFRSMTDGRDEAGNLLPDGVRLTKFGKLLRATSLDELPELWNILRGDMSIVGPRPLLVQYLPLYSAHQARRHQVRPGLTGLAQVNGRNAITWEQKFEYDVQYVDSITFLGDCKILLDTVKKVFRRDGISQAGEATVDGFRGSVKQEKAVK